MIQIPKIFKQDEGKPDIMQLPMMPLRDIVVFPYMASPLFVGREKSINALYQALNRPDKRIFLATQKKPEEDHPTEDGIHKVGTISKVLQILRLPDGSVKSVMEGEKRAKIRLFIPNQRFHEVEVEDYPDPLVTEAESEAFYRNLIELLTNYSKLNTEVTKSTIEDIKKIREPAQLFYTALGLFHFKSKDNQWFLETNSLSERFIRLLELIQNEIMILETNKKIQARVKKQMEQSQRNYYLNEQIRAIRKEMGEDEAEENELKELERRIKRKKMSREAAAKVRHEFNKLKKMTPMSAEATVTRNYIDWLIALPWFKKTRVLADIEKAEKILNEDHYGLEKPKERILEYLAVQALVKKMRGPILCLVGPPGVGKTSLAKSVARATGRKFVRLSLGGVRDEAEIRGHRRTYIGALPGKIIQSLRKVGVNNPVFCLDEVDKMSMDFRGDPSAALLEVLDPEQNYAFNDHYLDVDYDLSDIFFITTANTLPDIPLPLQDRMEIIRLPGYTEIEKYHIAVRHLIPKQLEANGLCAYEITFSENAVYTIIREYTREAGVRTLERQIASICRKIAKEVIGKDEVKPIRVTLTTVRKYLGPPQYRHSQVEEINQIGIVIGLAWTQFGGELLCIESVLMPGSGKFEVTGKLGDVMKESARAAISYVRSRADLYNIDPDFHQKYDIHVHVPEGAIPKDGPSAGIAICTSILSCLTRLPANRQVAMTGEITLRGRVLPIGGLKEKLLAAHRGGIHTVIIPKENIKDLHDVPSFIQKELQIVPVEHMDEVIARAIIEGKNRPLLRKTEEEPGIKVPPEAKEGTIQEKKDDNKIDSPSFLS